MARVSEHRSSVQGNSDRISSQQAVMSMDGCGKAGLGCKPSGFLCFLCFFFFFNKSIGSEMPCIINKGWSKIWLSNSSSPKKRNRTAPHSH